MSERLLKMTVQYLPLFRYRSNDVGPWGAVLIGHGLDSEARRSHAIGTYTFTS